jgi:L-cysteine:1D-myo-inositol 2-amino-2-deoxy-alpha-D-glucopyranoside ligase
MSASHARVAYSPADGEHVFARVYAHSGMVAYHGTKMSKSLGNLVFVSRLRASGADPMAVRLALLAHHYRGDWEWTDAGLAEATERLARWRAALRSAQAGAVSGGAVSGGTVSGGAASGSAVPSARAVLDQVRERLADDLDAPGALAAIDSWAASVLAGAPAEGDSRAAEDAALVRDTADALLGVAL